MVEPVNVRSKDELLTHNSDKEGYIKELEQLAAELHFIPVMHRLVMDNIKSTIDTIPKDELVFNVCDGSDIDGMPGPSVGTVLIFY